LATCLGNPTRFAEAEAAYRKALSIQPDYGHALGQAVSCARNSHDWSKARRMPKRSSGRWRKA